MNHLSHQINSIENIRSGLLRPLSGIMDYIIDDEERIINTDFFPNKTNITLNDINLIINTINEKLKQIKQIKKDIKNNDKLTNTEKEFLINNLNSNGLKLIMFKDSIFLEAEKTGFSIDIKERKRHLRKINKIQDIIYGPEISTNKNEVNDIVVELYKLFSKNSRKLSKKEQQYFLSFINIYKNNKQIKESNKKENSLIQDKTLNQKQIKEIIDLIIQLYGLNEWKSSIKDKGNFSINRQKNEIIIPEKTKTIKLSRLLELIDHEISTHMIRWSNTEQTLKTPGEGYIEIEEGMALMNEKLVIQRIQDVQLSPTIHHISSFIAENNDFKNTYKLLRIYYKLISNELINEEKISRNALDRTIRIKRFVSFYEKGANRKDVSYNRGEFIAKDLLENSLDLKGLLKDFYFSKLSLDDLELVSGFKKELDIKEDELKYPIWIGKIIYKKLSGEKIFLNKLKQDDFRFEIVDELTFNIKRKVINILNYINNI